MPDATFGTGEANSLPFATLYDLDREMLFGDVFEASPSTVNWTTTNANGGTSTVTTGELTVATSANANGSSLFAQAAGVPFVASGLFLAQATMRFGDTGLALNTRRFGGFTLSGTTPQNGFYFELNGTTMNVVSAKAGSATATAAASWSRNGQLGTFAVDTNYHLWEILWGDNFASFAIDGQVRHVMQFAGGSTATRVNVLTLPLTLSSVNVASAATNATLLAKGASLSVLGSAPQTGSTNASQTTVAASASNVTLLAANRNRKGATIYNDSAAICYVKLGATASTTSYSVQLPSGAYYEVPFGYAGIIDGIWATATGNARITELLA